MFIDYLRSYQIGFDCFGRAFTFRCWCISLNLSTIFQRSVLRMIKQFASVFRDILSIYIQVLLLLAYPNLSIDRGITSIYLSMVQQKDLNLKIVLALVERSRWEEIIYPTLPCYLTKAKVPSLSDNLPIAGTWTDRSCLSLKWNENLHGEDLNTCVCDYFFFSGRQRGNIPWPALSLSRSILWLLFLGILKGWSL